MKAEDLRTKSVDELNEQLKELLQEQFKIRMQHGAGQLTNTNGLRQARRDIARVKTILGQHRNADQANVTQAEAEGEAA